MWWGWSGEGVRVLRAVLTCAVKEGHQEGEGVQAKVQPSELCWGLLLPVSYAATASRNGSSYNVPVPLSQSNPSLSSVCRPAFSITSGRVT